MATIFDEIVGKAWELRYDSALDTTYRFNSRTSAWEVDGTGTPSSVAFPITWLTVGDVREDIDTGRLYRWSGSAWVLVVVKADITDTDNDGIPNTVEDNSITTAKIVNGAVTLAKTGITVSNVTVLAAETTGTVTVPTGSVVLSIVPVSNQDQLIDSVLVSGTTLTVTLAAAATADNVFKVVTIV